MDERILCLITSYALEAANATTTEFHESKTNYECYRKMTDGRIATIAQVTLKYSVLVLAEGRKLLLCIKRNLSALLCFLDTIEVSIAPFPRYHRRISNFQNIFGSTVDACTVLIAEL
jgi:hypothetical protein